MKKSNGFRVWVDSIWRDHCIECRIWREPAKSLSEYFNQYKWWLKREFKHQRSDGNENH